MSILEHAALVLSAGIDIRGLDQMDVYLLAGKIIYDQQLTRAVVKTLTGSVAPEGLREEILASWSEAERAALRERISGVLQMGKKKRQRNEQAEELAAL